MSPPLQVRLAPSSLDRHSRIPGFHALLHSLHPLEPRLSCDDCLAGIIYCPSLLSPTSLETSPHRFPLDDRSIHPRISTSHLLALHFLRLLLLAQSLLGPHSFLETLSISVRDLEERWDPLEFTRKSSPRDSRLCVIDGLGAGRDRVWVH